MTRVPGLSGGRRRTSEGEETLAWQLRAAGLPEPVREHRFHEYRRWRLDFAWPALRVAIEVEGGAFAGGRHVRGAGFTADCAKYAEAALAGWIVLRVTTAHVDDGQALAWIVRALELRGEVALLVAAWESAGTDRPGPTSSRAPLDAPAPRTRPLRSGGREAGHDAGQAEPPNPDAPGPRVAARATPSRMAEPPDRGHRVNEPTTSPRSENQP